VAGVPHVHGSGDESNGPPLPLGGRVAREEPDLDLRCGSFHGVNATAVDIEAAAEGGGAGIVCVASAVGLFTAFVEAVWCSCHTALVVDKAVNLSVAHVDGPMFVFGIVSLLDDVDFSFLRPILGRPCYPESGSCAAGLWLHHVSVFDS
jgi:hypothetical protein